MNPKLLSGFNTEELNLADLSDLIPKGYQEGIKEIVSGVEFNTMLHELYTYLNFLKQKGMSYYDEEEPHAVDDIRRHGKKIYFCVKANDSLNKQSPVTNTEYWKILLDMDKPIYDELANYALANHNHDGVYAKLTDLNSQVSLVTANCLIGGTISSTENDTTNTLDILSDGSCLDLYALTANSNSIGVNNGVSTNVSYGVDGAVFNGSNSYITIDDFPSLPQYTFSTKFKTSVSANQVIVTDTKTPYASSADVSFMLHVNSAGKLHGYISDGTTSLVFTPTKPFVADGVEHHVAVSVFADKAVCYLDGFEIGRVNGTHQVLNKVALLGKYGDSNSWYFDGTMKQARVLNRAVSQSEARLLYLEKYLTTVTLDNANISFSNGRSNGYDLTFESITQKQLSELTFQAGWNEVIKTKADVYSVSQNLSLLAETSDGVSNYFSITDGKYYDKDGLFLANKAPILQVLFDGVNILEVKKVVDFIGFENQNKGVIIQHKTLPIDSTTFTNSGSYVDTHLTVKITPKKIGTKFVVKLYFNSYLDRGSSGNLHGIYRLKCLETLDYSLEYSNTNNSGVRKDNLDVIAMDTVSTTKNDLTFMLQMYLAGGTNVGAMEGYFEIMEVEV